METDLVLPDEPARASKLFMVTATTRPQGADAEEDQDEGYCLAIRFCDVDGVARVERLMVQQVRDRYPTYRGLRPREVRAALVFTVWEVPDPPTRGGWPRWLGPTAYYV